MAFMGTNTDCVLKAIAVEVTSFFFFLMKVLSAGFLNMRKQYSDSDCQIMIWD